MRVITCYSYKGGAGRTLTAANLALYLAHLGFKVVALDFDFEAPGLDSKFSAVKIAEKQRGLLDLILDYQHQGSVPDTLEEFIVAVPLDPSIGEGGTLTLIPAGDYLDDQYAAKLNQLRWGDVFAPQKAGVAFLQGLMQTIQRSLQADFVVVDSRTGISETAGVCTQLLADEVIMFSSLASESVKMTSRLAQVIRGSEIAKALGKQIDVKVVVTRVPRPKDLERFRKQWRETFRIPDDKFFFLFSAPVLESDEFLAVSVPNRLGDLTANYVELFQSLNVERASDRIRARIEQTAKSVLMQPERAESRIRSLVALYPSEDAYRVAMRFFLLTQQPADVQRYAFRLLRRKRDDLEAHRVLAQTYMRAPITDEYERRSALQVFEWLDEHGHLTPEEGVYYADVLEDKPDFEKSFTIAARYMDDDSLRIDRRITAKLIACRTALKQGDRQRAIQLALQVPKEKVAGAVAGLLIDYYTERNEVQSAIEIATIALSRSLPSSTVIDPLVRLANVAPDSNEVQRLLAIASTEPHGRSRTIRKLLRDSDSQTPPDA
jgi:MinD-like ATPase involved in chromosome partitioning or flagellar assembly